MSLTGRGVVMMSYSRTTDRIILGCFIRETLGDSCLTTFYPCDDELNASISLGDKSYEIASEKEEALVVGTGFGMFANQNWSALSTCEKQLRIPKAFSLQAC